MKTFFTAVPAGLLAAFLAMSFTPAMAGSDDDRSGETGYNPGGNRYFGMPWANGNPYKNHRDYAEERDVEMECGACHEPTGVGYTRIGPGCLTCHGVKWDSYTRAPRNLSIGNIIMNGALGVNWTNPQKQHRDYAEERGVSSCEACHALYAGGVPDPGQGATNNGIGPGCLSCHGVKWDNEDDRSDDRSG